ncbi:MAG TPA: formylglycine-generating enzyme family protein [Gammaproteobacteria bacterium]
MHNVQVRGSIWRQSNEACQALTVLVRFGLLILLWGMQSVAVAAALIGKHVHPVNPPDNRCRSCHTQDNDIVEAAAGDPSKCGSCHEFKAAAKSQTLARKESSQLKQGAVTPSVKLPADAGMRFPLYYHNNYHDNYQNSRLGDAPNEMVLIPAGEFIMGSDKRLPDEGPQHRVVLNAFYIDVHEVTNLQYQKFNDQTRRRSPAHFRNRAFPQGKADHPVTQVSWEDADAYCQWAGKRLPTDQEWEKAARGTDGRTFPWGNDFDARNANTPLRWQQIGATGDTTPVGAFAGGVSPYGVYDMSGNVWEWTASWYQAYPNNQAPSESYGERYKTLKGGSWFDCSFYNCGISAPAFNRAFFSIHTKNDSFGFRCAKDV